MNEQSLLQQEMVLEIKEIMEKARHNVARNVNGELLDAYWNIGRVIVEQEQNSSKRAEYGERNAEASFKTADERVW